MKLSTFQAEDAGPPELGAVVDGGRIVPISRVSPQIAAGMVELISRWGEVEHEVRRIVDQAAGMLDLATVKLLAPIPRPGKIMAIGLNYGDHIAESSLATPEHQTWFSKAITAVNGPFAPLQIPKASPFVDYEAELVAVIGAGGRHISRDRAPGAVFGWCVGNDATVRDWQHRTTQWVVGKSFDTHAPFGPWITTADEVADAHALAVNCSVNGEERQNSNTSHLVFDVWAQVEHLSHAMTLEPGDLLFTGTPGGVGAAMKPRRFLKAGDVVRIEIEGLGAIENRCEPEA